MALFDLSFIKREHVVAVANLVAESRDSGQVFTCCAFEDVASSPAYYEWGSVLSFLGAPATSSPFARFSAYRWPRDEHRLLFLAFVIALIDDGEITC